MEDDEIELSDADAATVASIETPPTYDPACGCDVCVTLRSRKEQS